MFRRFTVNYAVFSIIMDAILTFLALAFAIQLRPNLPELPGLVPIQDISLLEIPPFLYLLVPMVWIIVFLLSSVYDPRRNYRAADEMQSVTLATLLAAIIIAGVLYLFVRDFSRYLYVVFVVIDLIFLLVWRTVARFISRLTTRPVSEKRVLIIGAGQVGRRVGQMMSEYNWTGLRLIGYLDDDPEKRTDNINIVGDIDDLRVIVTENDVDDVVVALPQRAYGRVNTLVYQLHDLPVTVRVVPDYFSLALYRASVDEFGGVPMINLRDPALNEVERLIKRIFDLVISGSTLIVFSPLMALIAFFIKLDSPGPAFFVQERAGENGRLFKMYKFRSMVLDADSFLSELTEVTEDGDVIFKRSNDPRVTRVGKFLRRTSMDELPQLLNVIWGDMSLVGPRPELPWLVDRYELWQRKRFAVPQGITGWWQVNGRSDRPLRMKTEDDLYYVRNYSLWLDVYILLKTLFIVIRGNGAF
jgi:exopolysaccharide biosynthesis polyprenyl glycosylphosphotransferase